MKLKERVPFRSMNVSDWEKTGVNSAGVITPPKTNMEGPKIMFWKR